MLHPELMKLAVATLLWSLMSKHRAGVPQPLLLVIQKPVLIGCPYTSGRTLGAHTNTITISIVESIHFFFNDISDLSNGTFEELSSFHYWETNFLLTKLPDDTPK